MSELNINLESIQRNNTFYINMYRHATNIYLLLTVVMLIFAMISLFVAFNPYKHKAIIATIDGRLLEPDNTYYQAKGLISRLLGSIL